MKKELKDFKRDLAKCCRVWVLLRKDMGTRSSIFKISKAEALSEYKRAPFDYEVESEPNGKYRLVIQ